MTSFRGAVKRLNCDSKISAIFFDLDNTLIATRKADAKASSKVADLLHREHGFGRELANETATNYLAAFRRCPDNPDMALVQWRSQLWYDVLPATHQHLATELYGRWLEWRYRYLALPDEVHTMLQTLRLQYLLGIITNGPTAAQWEKIDRLALNKYFDCILVSSDLPWAKPDRNIFYAACHYLGVPPGQCVMIGDKLETDIQVSRYMTSGRRYYYYCFVSIPTPQKSYPTPPPKNTPYRPALAGWLAIHTEPFAGDGNDCSSSTFRDGTGGIVRSPPDNPTRHKNPEKHTINEALFQSNIHIVCATLHVPRVAIGGSIHPVRARCALTKRAAPRDLGKHVPTNPSSIDHPSSSLSSSSW
uniref:N-acylneuraminate-9-phosphatase n=1 Tax=Anopheles marajoara TaxID=58244 RepID=A0A2M4BSA8_9DIPT